MRSLTQYTLMALISPNNLLISNFISEFYKRALENFGANCVLNKQEIYNTKKKKKKKKKTV